MGLAIDNTLCDLTFVGWWQDPQCWFIRRFTGKQSKYRRLMCKQKSRIVCCARSIHSWLLKGKWSDFSFMYCVAKKDKHPIELTTTILFMRIYLFIVFALKKHEEIFEVNLKIFTIRNVTQRRWFYFRIFSSCLFYFSFSVSWYWFLMKFFNSILDPFARLCWKGRFN